MEHWEYKIVKFEASSFFTGGKFDETNVDQVLNDLGANGWEIAAGFDTNDTAGATKFLVLHAEAPEGVTTVNNAWWQRAYGIASDLVQAANIVIPPVSNCIWCELLNAPSRLPFLAR